MNVLNFYLDRSINGNIGQRVSFIFKATEFYCSHEAHIVYDNEDGPQPLVSPLLAMAYDGGTFIASANEAGMVDLLDIYSLTSRACVELHQNAIFDIKWRPDEPGQLLTASGDLSMVLVDIESPTKKKAHVTNSHLCSVKSLDFYDTNIFASGARDGHIKVWDLRDCDTPKIDIPYAHVVNKKPPKRFKSCPTNVVSAVLFDNYHLYSGGASDGVIKVWDIRHKQKGKVQPLHQIPYGGKSGFSDKQGYTCLTMSKGLLYASCSDNVIYCYSPQKNKMVWRYKGARINNFTRISIMNDEYLVSGSMDCCACLWKLRHQNDDDQEILPEFVFPEESEVSSIDVVSKLGLIFTGTDWGRLRRWTFESTMPDKQSYKLALNYEEYIKNLSIREEAENNPDIIIDDNEYRSNTSTDTVITPRAQPQKSRRRRANRSPRAVTPKASKSSKSKQKSSEPLTPITNYYQKKPKTESPEV